MSEFASINENDSLLNEILSDDNMDDHGPVIKSSGEYFKANHSTCVFANYCYFFFQLEMLLSPSENSQSSIASKNAAAAAASSSSQSTNEPPVCGHNAIICFQNVQLMVN